MNFGDFERTYRNSLVEKMQNLCGGANRVIARIGQQDILLEGVVDATYRQASVLNSIAIRFGERVIHVRLQLYGYTNDNSIGIRVGLSHGVDGAVAANNCMLWSAVDGAQNQYRWKSATQSNKEILYWRSVPLVDQQNSLYFWHGAENSEGNINICELLDGFEVVSAARNGLAISARGAEEIDAVLSIGLPADSGLEEEAQLVEKNSIVEKISDIAAFHAKAIVLRALDWILLNAKSGISLRSSQDGGLNFDTVPPWTLLPILGDIRNQESRAPFVTAEDIKIKCENCEQGEQLRFSDLLYQTLAISLNLGRHLILTGPPGCGKSALAAKLGQIVAEKFGRMKNSEPKVVTASPSWTSAEIIGRYFPRPIDGEIEFYPGVFLEAIENGQCLVIDEFNRANMDECFGELFTVLAGQDCDLPYKGKVKDEDADLALNEDGQKNVLNRINNDYKTIRIVANSGVRHGNELNRRLYFVKDDFRLIETMNDVDKDTLHQFSFALLRRFDVIKISPPTDEVIDDILNAHVQSTSFPLLGPVAHHANNQQIQANKFKAVMSLIFSGPDGLVQKGLTSVAGMKDVMLFALRGFNPSGETTNRISWQIQNAEGVWGVFSAPARAHFVGNGGEYDRAVWSFLTLGLVLKIIPQVANKYGSELEDLEAWFQQKIGGIDFVLPMFFNENNGSYLRVIGGEGAQGTCFDFFWGELNANGGRA